ncbi:hypothetical protein BJY01DRAFT_105163 [Aspergillus pseudoustus]|uniref:Uncharacterized protein n=1 Tax=Aspergillus pseudoustus TaxID=1810923 RepID=A0ABR4IW05_9EURO
MRATPIANPSLKSTDEHLTAVISAALALWAAKARLCASELRQSFRNFAVVEEIHPSTNTCISGRLPISCVGRHRDFFPICRCIRARTCPSTPVTATPEQHILQAIIYQPAGGDPECNHYYRQLRRARNFSPA